MPDEVMDVVDEVCGRRNHSHYVYSLGLLDRSMLQTSCWVEGLLNAQGSHSHGILRLQQIHLRKWRPSPLSLVPLNQPV